MLIGAKPVQKGAFDWNCGRPVTTAFALCRWCWPSPKHGFKLKFCFANGFLSKEIKHTVGKKKRSHSWTVIFYLSADKRAMRRVPLSSTLLKSTINSGSSFQTWAQSWLSNVRCHLGFLALPSCVTVCCVRLSGDSSLRMRFYSFIECIVISDVITSYY